MSIRLRLTLLYSTILALTLIAFSTILYVAQSQVTWDALTTTLERQAEAYVNTERRAPRRPDGLPPSSPPLPGRWTQTRGPDGRVIGQTADLGEVVLPLSDAGQNAAMRGIPWFETAEVGGEPLLIHSRPVFAQDRVVRIVQVATSLAEREQSLGTLRLILLVGSGLVILAAFAVGWLLAGAALSPIHRITHTAQAIGAERDFSRRVLHVGPVDEVGQLAVTFNGMLTELESAYRQVEQALQAQRRFVADASHELRTPLTTIRGNIELLRRQPPIDDKEQADVLVDTRDEADRMIRLVNQLLDLARADTGPQLQCEPVPVKPLVEDVCRQARLLAPRRTIQCEGSLDRNALADRDALKQVLLILLDNARIHTPQHATITVTCSISDSRVAICIRDTGPGIAADLLPHIFERFFRGDVSRTGGGAGLGLSIAKELVHAQGGTLTVTSQVGQGSVFTVALPLAKDTNTT